MEKLHFINHSNSNHQQNDNHQQHALWQQYCQKLQLIASTYSDSYWSTQNAKQLQKQKGSIQSKTKQAFQVLNDNKPNLKIQLINKILKNLSKARKIQDNMENLVLELIETNNKCSKYRKSQESKINLRECLNSVKEQSSHMDTFNVNFDEKKLDQFENQWKFEEKDLDI